jgi:phenylalanyl-tRNA synthetase beta chain
MIVSWNWLAQYVPLAMDRAELEHRLAMAGLNHESTERHGDDWVIDLEVTSNRPDCLGHLGVAREISVLWELPLEVPQPDWPVHGDCVTQLTRVSISCPRLCARYTARVIRGVRIGPSPDWLARRLESVGIAVINNVVDISNYVMMECGQPLHVFDLRRLRGPEIIVREALPGEQFEAIDHRRYPLEPGMCVIADAERAVAIAGVMGGVDSEVSDTTTDLLIESAEFAPLAIRTTARKLGLHSPSSYRFERGVDPLGVDWASRRCCELILKLAGGHLAPGVWDVGAPLEKRAPIALRLNQLSRLLGIDVPVEEVRRTLVALGGEQVTAGPDRVTFTPPSWRRDLTREIDLIEEVGRIHGYDRIPEDVGVPMVASHRRDDDRVLAKVRHTLTAAGFDEAMTASVVPLEWCESFSPWSDAPPLRSSIAMLKGADVLRKSLIPSLLDTRRFNESVGNPEIELFETARIYLPQPQGLPREQHTLGATSGNDFLTLKGLVESLLGVLHVTPPLSVSPAAVPLLDPERQCRLSLGEHLLGYLGEVTAAACKLLGLRGPTSVLEIDLQLLAELARLIPRYEPLSDYPSISRDLNLIVDEEVSWTQLETTIRLAAGALLETLSFQEIYRDPSKDGTNKKRLLFSVALRSADRTLTNEQADQIREAVVDACHREHGAVLLG